ncbi:ATP-grasp domain-containing protein [Taibaiella koreensis]|uniref:hypothetical protein n=1 Tax=Taibaiella koreensis TaxID=1268548 RepID=UPI0013C2BC68|nr:hypothetical protein [Taibaiella koreensis]
MNKVSDLEDISLEVSRGNIEAVYLNGSGMLYPRIETTDPLLQYHLREYLKNDAIAVWQYLFATYLKNLNAFGNLPFPGNMLNKLNVLEAAKNLGLAIPGYEIVYKRDRMNELKETWERIICKPLADGVSIVTDEVIITGQYTEEISSKDIAGFEDIFSPTLIQQLVAKIFEIRVFFFREKLYSLALFSQSDRTSQIDSRLNNLKSPQRQVPFILPDELQDKIKLLMSELTLDYGSLDFIVTPENNFVFLEVNPYGQYGFLSKSGNFYIEKEIAEYLCTSSKL